MKNDILNKINNFNEVTKEDIIDAMPQNKICFGKSARVYKFSKVDYYNFIGESNYIEGNYEEALKDFNTAIFIYDEDKVFFIVDENTTGVIGDLQARKIAKDNYSNRFFLDKRIIILNRAKVLYKLHEYLLSLQELRSLIELIDLEKIDYENLFEIKKLEFDNYYELKDFRHIIECGEVLKKYLDDDSIDKIDIKLIDAYRKIGNINKVDEILYKLSNSNDEYVRVYAKKYGRY